MKTDAIQINQLSPNGYEWYLGYLTALDAKDIDCYGQYLADDCTLTTNNADPVVGKDAVLNGLAYYWQSFGELEHELLNIYGTDSAFVLEALNHYKRLDGSEVTLRAVALTDRDPQGLVTSVRLYTDTSPLFAENAG